jgi:DNA-directed RNA polymerase subunit beta
MNVDKTNPDNIVFDAKIIPSRGAWLEFEIDKKVLHMFVGRKRKTPYIFLKALGLAKQTKFETYS